MRHELILIGKILGIFALEFLLMRFVVVAIFESRIPGYPIISLGLGAVGTLGLFYLLTQTFSKYFKESK